MFGLAVAHKNWSPWQRQAVHKRAFSRLIVRSSKLRSRFSSNPIPPSTPPEAKGLASLSPAQRFRQQMGRTSYVAQLCVSVLHVPAPTVRPDPYAPVPIVLSALHAPSFHGLPPYQLLHQHTHQAWTEGGWLHQRRLLLLCVDKACIQGRMFSPTSCSAEDH